MKEYQAPLCELQLFSAADLLMETNGLIVDDFSDMIKKALNFEE